MGRNIKQLSNNFKQLSPGLIHGCDTGRCGLVIPWRSLPSSPEKTVEIHKKCALSSERSRSEILAIERSLSAGDARGRYSKDATANFGLTQPGDTNIFADQTLNNMDRSRAVTTQCAVELQYHCAHKLANNRANSRHFATCDWSINGS